MQTHSQTFDLEWDGIPITIEYDPDHSKTYRDTNGYALTRLAIRAANGEPFPLSKTGYHAAYLPAPSFDLYDSPAEYVRDWIDFESDSPEWQRFDEDRRQYKLF